MIKFNRIVFITSITLLICACSSSSNMTQRTYPIVYDTEPQGASIICNNINRGYTPVVLRYPVEYDTASGEPLLLNPRPCQAVWSSGVRAEFSILRQTYPKNGLIARLQRPDEPGYSQDAEFALKVKGLQAAQNAAIAQTTLANASVQRGTNYSSLPSLPSLPTMQNNSFQNNTVRCRDIAVSTYTEIKTFSGSICPFGWTQAN